MDVFIGGGEDFFRNRTDKAGLSLGLEEQGYDVVYKMSDLMESKSEKIAGLLAKVDMPKASEGRTGILPEMTKKAIETLSRNKTGFFLMVEGSMIDWGAHAKDLKYVTDELVDFDNAIHTAMDYAEKNGKTLVVVTGDHETGGLSLVNDNSNGQKISGNFIQTGGHTGAMVPIDFILSLKQYFERLCTPGKRFLHN